MTIEVTVEKTGHVARIVFSKPPHNFACTELLGRIADALDDIDNDMEIRCSVLASSGKAFCAGADLAGDTSITGDDGMASVARLYDQAARLFGRKKPMVAAIQGAAIGAGLGLALSADFRVASPAARFASNFVRLGFHPGFALTCTLPRAIGQQNANWMMLSAERIKADTALAWGLVDRMVDDAELLAEAHRMAEEIAANAPLALVAVRSSMLGDLADKVVAAMKHEHTQQGIMKKTIDYEEGVASVFERRDARFIGR